MEGHGVEPGHRLHVDVARPAAAAFGEEDQRELAGVVTELSEKGAFVMLSNSDTPFVRELYGKFRIETVTARRAVNSDANGRGNIQEVVALNY